MNVYDFGCRDWLVFLTRIYLTIILRQTYEESYDKLKITILLSYDNNLMFININMAHLYAHKNFLLKVGVA